MIECTSIPDQLVNSYAGLRVLEPEPLAIQSDGSLVFGVHDCHPRHARIARARDRAQLDHTGGRDTSSAQRWRGDHDAYFTCVSYVHYPSGPGGLLAWPEKKAIYLANEDIFTSAIRDGSLRIWRVRVNR
jgi:hypothetical protein